MKTRTGHEAKIFTIKS